MDEARPAARERFGGRRPAARWMVAGLCLLAWALRLHGLEWQPLWSDEGLSLYRSAQSLREILSNRIVVDGFPTQDLSPPLYFVLLHATRALFGESLFGLRVIGAMAGTLCVPLVDAAGRRLFGTAAGATAALLLALSPLHLWYSQELRPYPLQMALGLAALVLLWDALGPRGPAPRGLGRADWVRLAAWLALSALAIYVHYFAVFVVAAQALVALGLAWRRGYRRAVLAIAGLATLLVLPLLPRALDYFGGPMQVDYARLPVRTILHQGLSAFAVGISPTLTHPRESLWPLGLALLLGTAFGLARSRWRAGTLAALAMLLVPIAAVILLSRLNPIYNGPRHLLPALPAFYLLAALAAVGLAGIAGRAFRRLGGAGRWSGDGAGKGAGSTQGDTRRPWGWLLGAAAILLLLLGAGLWARTIAAQIQRQGSDPRYTKDDVRSAALLLAARARPGDLILLHDPLIQFVFGYDYEGNWRGAAPWTTLPRFGEQDLDTARARLAELGEEHARIWYLTYPEPRGFPDPVALPEEARALWSEVDEREFPHMWLQVWLSAFDTRPRQGDRLPDEVVPVTVRWDNGLGLVGVTRDEGILQPGHGYRGRLFWRLDTPSEHDYGRELRLLDAEGEVAWKASDALAFRWPVVEWPAGPILDLPLDFDLPADLPPGDYRLQLRLIPAGAVPEPVLVASGLPHEGAWLDLASVTLRSAPVVDVERRLRLARLARDPERVLLDRPIGFAGGPTVLAYGQLPEQAQAGQALNPLLTWTGFDPSRSAGPAETALLRIVGADGREVARSELSLNPPEASEALWQQEDLIGLRHPIRLPSDLEPGRYRLQVALAGADGEPRARRPWFGLIPRPGAWATVAELELEPIPLETTLPAVDRERSELFGEAIALRGYRWCGEGEISEAGGEDLLALPVGAPLCLELVWEARAKPERDFKVFVHVRDPASPAEPLAQSDAVPVGWTRPTGGWRPGELLIDRHEIGLSALSAGSADGDLEIVVGIYDPESGERLPVTGVPGAAETGVLSLAKLRFAQADPVVPDAPEGSPGSAEP